MKMKIQKTYKIHTTEDLLTLMNIYLEEWKHRDSMLWKQVFTYFFAILIVMIIPFANINGFSLGDKLPQCAFPIVGLVLDLIYAIICYNYAARLSSVGKAYTNIIDMLPRKYQRTKIKDKPFIFGMAYFLSFIFPLCLLVLGILLIHVST